MRLTFLVLIGLWGISLLLGESPMESIYSFEVKDIDGKQVKLDRFAGKVLMVVNVASKCGFTRQYAGLQELYQKFKEKGLVILGFPANNFLSQEPGTNQKIKEFCQVNYGVTFPMFAKISVAGKDIHPLYKYLTGKETNPKFGGRITWNFNKFLINRQGLIVNRFSSRVKPLSKKILGPIVRAVQE